MARNDDLSIRLNAQANLTNIDSLKKDLEKVMTGIELDKSVETSLNKIIKQMSGLEKVFENISKKDTFNVKDIESVTKKTQELQNLMKDTSSILKNIDMTTIIKSSEQYKNLMEDINKQTLELKKNFKDSTGLDYDKEIQGINNLKNNINELKNAKEQLKQNGASLEYQKLLEQQNAKLDEQRQKLQNLKQLQSEIVTYQNQMAQNKGFSNYEELKKIATTKGNKVEFTNNKMLEAEQQEVKRLTAEYAEFEKQLKKIETYKNQASKTRGLKKLAEQLGIDKTSFQDIDKAIKQMQELVNVTARNSVQGNSGLKKQISDIYAETVRARNAAKEYVAEIERGANAKIITNATTNIKTTSSLNNEVANISALLGAADTEDANDSLLVQAEQQNTNAINNLDSKIQQMVSLFNTLQNTMNAIFGIEGMEKAFLDSSVKSLQNIDNDTTDIISSMKTTNISQEDLRKNYSNETKQLLGQSEREMGTMVYQSNEPYKLSNVNNNVDGILYMYQQSIESYLKQAFDNMDSKTGKINFETFTDIEKLGFEEVIERTKERLEQNLPNLIENKKALEEEIKSREAIIEANNENIAKEQKRLNQMENQEGQLSISSMSAMENSRNKIERLRSINGAEDQSLDTIKTEYQIINDELEQYRQTQKSLAPILESRTGQELKVGEVLANNTAYQIASLELEDARKKSDTETIKKTEEKYLKLSQESQGVNQLDGETKKLINTQQLAGQEINSMTRSLISQAQQLQQNSLMSRTFQDTFGKMGQTLGTYISLNYIINRVFGTLKNGINTVKEMDASITQIGIVTGKTAQQVWSSFDTYNTQAKRLNTTTTELLEATKLYYQQGLNTAEVNKMVEATAIAAALGEVQMAEAADTLTAIMNGYGMVVTQAMEVTDKISAVGADSAADFGELSTAIEKVASSAATAGVDLDHLLGYLGKMIETTREAPTNIGSAMKTIIARMAEIKADPTKALEDGTNFNKVQTALETVGIKLADTNGEMRQLQDIFDELGGKWTSLSKNQKAYIATVVAGNRQQSRFLAMMNDYDRTMELVNSSIDSAGRSSEQFRNYSTGLESSLNKVKAEMEDFYVSFTKGSNGIKIVYDVFAKFMNLLNTLGPLLSTTGLGITTFVANTIKNANKLKKEQALTTIGENISRQLREDKEGNVSSIIPSNLFGGTSNGNFASSIFSSKNSKELKELNTLIEQYNGGLFKTAKATSQLEGVNNKYWTGIQKIAKENEIGIQQSAGIFIQQRKQTIGTKALTASMWANVVAQAAMTVGISLLIAGVSALVAHFSDLNKANRESAEQAADNASRISSEADAMETQIGKYKALKEKVSLTAEEKEELNNINNEILEKYPELIEGIDAEGNAYLKSGEKIEYYLKQKKIAAEEAKINSARMNLNKGDTANNKAATGTGWLAGINANIKDEDTYGEESEAQLKSLKTSIEDFKNNDKTLGSRNLGFRMFNLVAATLADDKSIFTNVIDKITKANPYSEDNPLPINNIKNFRKQGMFAQDLQKIISGEVTFDDSYYDYIKENYSDTSNYEEGVKILQRFEQYLGATKKELETNYKSIYESQRKIALLNANSDKESESLITGMSNDFIGGMLDSKKEVFGNDINGYKEWLQGEGQEKTQSMTDAMIKSLKGNNKDEVLEAYKKLTEMQKNGESVNEIRKQKSILFGEMSKTYSLTDEEKAELKQGVAYSLMSDDKELDEIVSQAIESSGLGENEGSKNSLTNILRNYNANVREQILNGLGEFSKTEGYTKEAGSAYIDVLNQLLDPENGDKEFQEAFEKTDFTNALDVEKFKESQSQKIIAKLQEKGIKNPKLIQAIVDSIAPDPGVVTDEIGKKIGDTLKKSKEINEQSFEDLFKGGYDFSAAQEDGFKLFQGSIINGNFVIDTDEVVSHIDESNKAMQEHIELLKRRAIESVQKANEEISKQKIEIGNIQAKATEENRNLTDEEQKQIEKIRDKINEQEHAITNASKEYDNAKRLTNELQRQVEERQRLSQQGFFFDYARDVDENIQGLKDLASVYDEIKEGELTQLDIIEMLANNTELLSAVYVNERGELALNKNALEEMAKSRIKEAIANGESKIAQLEQLKGMIDGEQIYTDARRADMEARVQQNKDLEKANEDTVNDTETKLQGATGLWDSFVNGLKNNVLPKFGNFLTNLLGGLSLFKTKSGGILSKITSNIRNAFSSLTNMDVSDETSQKSGLAGLVGKLKNAFGKKNNIDTSGDDTTINLGGGADSNTQIEKWQNLNNYEDDGTGISGSEYRDRVQKQIDEIKAINSKLQQMYDSGSILESINNMKNSGGSKDKSGKEFEAYMEYFEKFYNYVKRIQNIEAKINRLREKRNIIDANKNYYIEDLKKENELLAQQANIYNEYIGAQKNYLRDLRSQIASTYGDLAYFTDEGLLQLKVSEVWISSESQEDRIKEFQRLMEEYESQYETMQENETKLYEIQKTQLENITNMYDKLLQRLDDVRENLEFIQSISEHKITMAYGDLKTLDLLNDKLKTTINLWGNADHVVQQLKGDMKIIQDQVNSSNLGHFLQWDEDLSQYRITDAFYDDLVRQEWESMGANWSEVTTWVTTTAKKSEEIANKTRETTESLMDAEETLKSIVEDRLNKIESIIGGWTGEITKLFDLISRTTDIMNTKQEIFGITTGSLQEEYDAVVAAGALAKRTYEDLKNKQKDLLSEITSMYGQYITVNEYGAAINETAIRESTKLTEAEKAELAEIAATYNLIQEASQEAEDTMYDNFQKRIELEERKRDAIIEIQNQLHDMLMEQDQKELDDLQKKYDEMSKLDNEYYSKLQQKIQDARNAREDRQSQIQTDQLKAQIALAQKDNTSQYNQQLIDLQKQLNEQLQAQADAEIDRELERIEREQQEREEDREMQIQQLENLITFKDENGIYWQESQAIFNQGMSETLNRLVAWNEEQNASEIQKATTLEGYVSNAHQAFVDYSKIEFDKIDAQSEVVGKIQQMMKDFYTGEVKIDDKGINNALGFNSNFLGAKVQTMTDYLNQNLGGLQDALNEVKDSRETLWWLLRKIYNKIYNPNDSSYFVETGIASSGGSSSGSGNSNGGGSGSGSGGSGSGDGIARIGDVVTYSGQYYYDSFGRRPAGSVYSGRSGAVVIDNYSATKYGGSGRNTGNYDVHIKSADGRYSNLGWVKLSQLSGYKKGGYVDFTGPAMVHGTKNAPEAFLNSRQTALFENLRDTLVDSSKTTRKSSETKESNTEKIEVGEVNISVQEIADMGTLIRDSINQMKQEIVCSINKQTAMRVRR